MLDALRKLYRNTLFRQSLLGATLFVISLIIALGYVYFATISSELRRVDKAMTVELTELQNLYKKDGPQAVSTEIWLRSTSNEGLYLIRYQNLVAGNLAFRPVENQMTETGLLPEQGNSIYTKINFTYGDPEAETSDVKDRRARGLITYLKTGEVNTGVIWVARDVETTLRTADRVKNAILTSSAIALFLGLLSSWYVSRRFSRRIEAFNALATDIRAGKLDRRAVRNYSEDELDLLAEHLNAMLDHIDRLMQAMRYAGDSIAHDLRSPLTRLRTRLESSAAELGEGQASDTLYSAADDANDLLKTFDSVLRIARLEAGERRELLIALDPKPLLDDIAELYEPACEDADLEFTARIDTGLTVLADRGLLSQAVSNLVENAIKYTPSGGAISLTLKKNKSGQTEIEIVDNGPGIPQAHRQRVKERFVRLEESRTAPGSGLGLALVDAVADLHRAEFILGDRDPVSGENTGLSAKLVFPRVRSLKNTARAAE